MTGSRFSTFFGCFCGHQNQSTAPITASTISTAKKSPTRLRRREDDFFRIATAAI
jgi:hypothetical protein